MSQVIVPVSAVGAEPSTNLAQINAAQPDFGQWLNNEVTGVNQDVNAAEHAVQTLAVGRAESLPEVMVAIDNARNSLSLMLQVRDRLLSAYQDILRMQI